MKFVRALWRSKKKGKNLWVSAHVVHTISKQVISRHGKNENGCETYKMGKKRKKEKSACKRAISLQTCGVLVAVAVVVVGA